MMPLGLVHWSDYGECDGSEPRLGIYPNRQDNYCRMIVLRHNGTKVMMLTAKGIEEYDFSGRTRLGLSDHLYVTYKCQRKCIRCISFVVNSALYDDYEV